MDFLGNLATGFSVVLTPANLLYALMGAMLGTAVGVLPGLGVAPTIALLFPVTYKIPPTSAVIMLAGIYYGAMYGGSTTSILLNIPGETASVATCLDGYQMARQGRAGPALGISAMGSFFAGTMATFGLTLIALPLASFALKFGPAEYFSLVILGMTMAVYLSGGSITKGLIMIVFGIVMGTVGLDPISGAERFTFGLSELTDGINFVAVTMGLFGISEVLMNIEAPEIRDVYKTSLKGLFPSLEDWRKCWASVLRGSLLGCFIGVLPGPGAIMSSFISYAVEKRVSKHPELFGKGAIEGVAAPESANNAASTTAFIPLMTLGIPGNAGTAMIFVALMIHGIRPGPMLFQEHPDLFWGLIASFYVGNVMLLALNLPLIGMWVKMLKVPYPFLGLTVLITCVVGAYSVNFSLFDVWTMVAFGIFGYWTRKGGFPPAPLILALLLGPMLERTMSQSLLISGGDPLIFVQRPLSAGLLAVTAVIMLLPAFKSLWSKLCEAQRG